VVTFVRFLVSFPSSQNHRPTPMLETFPGLRGIDGGVCFDRAQCDLERLLAQSWRESARYVSGAWTLAKPRTVFALLFRRSYRLELFRKRKSPSLDAQLVGVRCGWYFNSSSCFSSTRLGRRSNLSPIPLTRLRNPLGKWRDEL